MNATIFDYGAGNIHSLAKALERAGATITIETDPIAALDTGLLVLPGVGAFGAAAARLAPARDAWRARIGEGLPCLGVCLGMQLLYESSDEGEGEGLGILRGSVTRLAARRVPHIGWNVIEEVRDGAFAASGFNTGYFAHSFACRPAEPETVTAWCRHESERFAAAVRSGKVLGVQFHPEKSSGPGIAFLAAFVREIAAGGVAGDVPDGPSGPPRNLTVAGISGEPRP